MRPQADNRAIKIPATEEEIYAVNATVRALDKLDIQYLHHPALKAACRAARAALAEALAEASK